jgi:hypothetical protein
VSQGDADDVIHQGQEPGCPQSLPQGLNRRGGQDGSKLPKVIYKILSLFTIADAAGEATPQSVQA